MEDRKSCLLEIASEIEKMSPVEFKIFVSVTNRLKRHLQTDLVAKIKDVEAVH